MCIYLLLFSLNITSIMHNIMQLLSFLYALSFKDLGYVWMQITLKVTYKAKNCIIFSQINGIQYKIYKVNKNLL
jgi:hypothetical protein